MSEIINSQQTFIMVKPDGVDRGLIGNIIQRFEDKGLKLVALKLMKINPELARNHYQEHLNKPFYSMLEEFITSGPVVAMVWEGRDAVMVGRNLTGKTSHLDAAPGTIRGDYCGYTTYNLIHASAQPDEAVREISLFFESSEIQIYNRTSDHWF